jgi:hypothetical protein
VQVFNLLSGIRELEKLKRPMIELNQGGQALIDHARTHTCGAVLPQNTKRNLLLRSVWSLAVKKG